MTRAQYESKYGSAPKPAPVTMTRAEYEAKYGSTPQATQPAETGLFSRIKSGVGQAVTDRGKTVAEAKSRVQQGKQTTAEGIFQAAGQTAGLITDTAMIAAKEGVRSVAPAAIPVVKRTISDVMQTKPVQKAVEAYGGFKEQHPRAAANIEAAANIGGVFPTAKGTQIAAKTGAKAAITGADVAVKGAEKAGKAAVKVPHTIQAGLTNVRRDVYERASNPEWAPLIERAIEHVSKNEKQPYFEVAKRTSDAINTAEDQAARRLGHEKMFFKSDNPGARFDVASKYEDIVSALKPYRSSGLVVEGTPGPRGSVLDYKIGQTPQSSFTPREVQKLNELLAKLKASKEVEIDDLLALRQSFSTAYDEIPLGVNGDPRPYHAAVMSLKSNAEATIDKILPPGLKEAFAQYRVLEEMKSAIGNRVIDGKGNLKDTAEQFLANLGNMNKGNVRGNADDLKALTGIDIVKEVQAVKDAQALSSWSPRTGDRQLDIMRAVYAPGVFGFAGGGLLGGALTAAATSPKLHGKAALAIGKARGSKAGKSVGEYLKKAQPGLSIRSTNPLDAFDAEDLSDVTRAAEQIRSGKLLSQPDWEHLQKLMQSYGYTLPENQKKASDFILTAVDSSQRKALDKSLDAQAVIPATKGGQKVAPRQYKKKAPSSTVSKWLRDSVGRFAPKKKTIKDALSR